MSNENARRYLTHDCDQARVELLLQPSGNGDWYLSIVREGQKFNRLAPLNEDELLPPPATIRIVMHGERKEHAHIGAAVAGLWRALGGEAVRSFREPILDRLARQNWPKHLGRPGERVLLLVAQGFRGTERKVEAQQAEALASTCRSDEEAMEFLGGFQWNQLADLPFPIRELLGIDALGNFLDEFPKDTDGPMRRPKLTLELAERMHEYDMSPPSAAESLRNVAIKIAKMKPAVIDMAEHPTLAHVQDVMAVIKDELEFAERKAEAYDDFYHRWCVFIFREGGQRPSTFAAFEQEDAARRAFSSWSAQWSDSYLCRIVDGPKRRGAPGGDHVIDVSNHEWATPPVYGPGEEASTRTRGA